MRRLIPIALIVLAVLWFILNSVGSSMALSDFAARPVVALTREDGTRVPVAVQDQAPGEADARLQVAEGIFFGYRFTYALPDGARVTCAQRFRGISCDGGWIPERQK